MKKNKQKPQYLIGFDGLNIMKRHEMVNGLAEDVKRKLSAELITQQREKEIVNEAICGAVLAMAGVLMNKWGYLVDKKTRLKRMYEFFNEALQNIENPNELQLAAEAELMKQAGIEIRRE